MKSWFRELVDPTFKENINEDYRRLFETEIGRRVLSHMLGELKFFPEAITEEDVALQNYARRLLMNIGIWDKGNALNITQSLLYASRLKYKEKK